jgi:hypothetical protein
MLMQTFVACRSHPTQVRTRPSLYIQCLHCFLALLSSRCCMYSDAVLEEGLSPYRWLGGGQHTGACRNHCFRPHTHQRSDRYLLIQMERQIQICKRTWSRCVTEGIGCIAISIRRTFARRNKNHCGGRGSCHSGGRRGCRSNCCASESPAKYRTRHHDLLQVPVRTHFYSHKCKIRPCLQSNRR